MFEKLVGSKYPAHKSGIVLTMHLPSKKYFLNNANDVHAYLARLRRYVSNGERTYHAFEEFKQLAYGSKLEDWEFMYSFNPNEPLPKEIIREWTYVCSNVKSDAVLAKHSDSTIFEISHTGAAFSLFVVGKSSAVKKSIVKRTITLLGKYLSSKETAWCHKYVSANSTLFERAKQDYTDALENLSGRSLRDVYYEPVAFDKDIFTTPQVQATAMNLHSLKECFKALGLSH